MKHIKTTLLIIITSLFIFSGCVTLNKYSVASYDLDLTQFEKEGLFVTTGDCFQKYKSISILTVECYHGYVPKGDSKKKKTRTNVHEDDIYASSNSVSSSPHNDNPNDFDFKVCELPDLFSEIINQAKRCGANGIIKLEIRNVSRDGEASKTIQRGVEIVGLAVHID